MRPVENGCRDIFIRRTGKQSAVVIETSLIVLECISKVKVSVVIVVKFNSHCVMCFLVNSPHKTYEIEAKVFPVPAPGRGSRLERFMVLWFPRMDRTFPDWANIILFIGSFAVAVNSKCIASTIVINHKIIFIFVAHNIGPKDIVQAVRSSLPGASMGNIFDPINNWLSSIWCNLRQRIMYKGCRLWSQLDKIGMRFWDEVVVVVNFAV